MQVFVVSDEHTSSRPAFVSYDPCRGLSQTFTNDARLIGDSIHMLRMGLRDIKQPFYLARMMVSDEIKSRSKMTQVNTERKVEGVEESTTITAHGRGLTP